MVNIYCLFFRIVINYLIDLGNFLSIISARLNFIRSGIINGRTHTFKVVEKASGLKVFR